MSHRTIHIIDLLCNVENWNNAIRSAAESNALCLDVPPAWHAEAADEIRRWTVRRDRKLKQLKATVAALTPPELDLIRRKYNPTVLAHQLREIGVRPRW